jgi:hypothetical protein
VYKNYGDGPVNFVWNGPADGSDMISMESASFPSEPSYLEFRGFNMDGRNNASNGFKCRGSHHLRFVGNTIINTGGGGISTVLCDYLTADHNVIHHNGYLFGWTSGISFNSNQWFDSNLGFHNVISNNIVAGEYDSSPYHTDGNGIILDLSNRTYDSNSANTPPALVINNVVYGNGGRCFQAYVVTNFWFVNNTCYKNSLDTTLGNAGSVSSSKSRDGYFINNISVAWRSDAPSYEQLNPSVNIQFYANLYSGSPNNFSVDPSQFIAADPLFLNAPVFVPVVAGQWATALAPALLDLGLTLVPTSPALAMGIDPSTLPNLPPEIVTDLQTYLYSDINGNPRPRGGGVDLGAYQMTPVP